MRGKLIGMLLATLTFAALAGACGYFMQSALNRDQSQPHDALTPMFVVTPTVAAALVAVPVWWLIVIRRGRPGLVRGAGAGAVCVLISYPVYALLVTALSENGFLSLWPMLVIPPIATGWFTLPIGMGVGAVLGRVQWWLLAAPVARAAEPGV
jgi:hypothetical protein